MTGAVDVTALNKSPNTASFNKTYLAVMGLPFLAILAFPAGWEGRGLSARFMLSTK